MDSSAQVLSSPISLLSVWVLGQALQVFGLDDERGERCAQAVVDFPGESAALFDHRQPLQVALERDHVAVRGVLALVQVDDHVDDDEVQRRIPNEDQQLVRPQRYGADDLVDLGDDGQGEQRREDGQRLGKEDDEDGREHQLRGEQRAVQPSGDLDQVDHDRQVQAEGDEGGDAADQRVLQDQEVGNAVAQHPEIHDEAEWALDAEGLAPDRQRQQAQADGQEGEARIEQRPRAGDELLHLPGAVGAHGVGGGDAGRGVAAEGGSRGEGGRHAGNTTIEAGPKSAPGGCGTRIDQGCGSLSAQACFASGCLR